MTTIAYRDGILAADGQANRGDMVVDLNVAKVRRLKDGSLLAVTGSPAPFEAFAAWLNSGEGAAPNVSGNTAVIHLRKNGSLRVYEDGGWTMESHRTFRAWGSGWMIATAAMMHGATAEEAVRTAAKLDVWTGGRIRVLSLQH